jgi:hypothetical protein
VTDEEMMIPCLAGFGWVEIALCLASFGLVSLLLLVKGRWKEAIKLKDELLFVPGLITANLVSLFVSRPGDFLFRSEAIPITDLPVCVGFPLSFYSIGAWGDNRLYLSTLAINIAIVAMLGLLLARYRRAQLGK